MNDSKKVEQTDICNHGAAIRSVAALGIAGKGDLSR
jgi:hypothetical protein